MEKRYAQFRIWVETLKKLRRIYAETGEDMIAIVDRLVDQEYQRLTREDAQIQTVPQRKE
jgi:hypothetical protein